MSGEPKRVQCVENPDYLHTIGKDATSLKNNQRMIDKLVRDYFWQMNRSGLAVEMDDVRQEVMTAWWLAKEGFNPEMGYRFSTYLFRVVQSRIRIMLESEHRNTKKLGIVSIDKNIGSEQDGGDSAVSLYDYLASSDAMPDQAEEIKENAREIVRRLSPLARQALEWLIDPPEHLQWELEALRHRSIATQSPRRIPSEPNLSIVIDYVSRLNGLKRTGYYGILRELKSIYQ